MFRDSTSLRSREWRGTLPPLSAKRARPYRTHVYCLEFDVLEVGRKPPQSLKPSDNPDL